MLLNDFFKITGNKEEDNTQTFSIQINPQHKIFNGHFPDNPVVPGVCMLQMLTNILNHQHQCTFLLAEAKLIKFTKIINPEEISELAFQIKEENTEQGLKIQAQLNSSIGNHFKLSGIFKNV